MLLETVGFDKLTFRSSYYVQYCISLIDFFDDFDYNIIFIISYLNLFLIQSMYLGSTIDYYYFFIIML